MANTINREGATLAINFQWTRPHCQRPQIVTDSNYFSASGKIRNPPEEAQVLIELIETLFDEWYVSRHKRQQKLANLRVLADSKKETLEQLKIGVDRQKALPSPGGAES